MTNSYKEYLDKLLAQIETYKFTVKKLEQLFKYDEEQLSNGGDYLNLSAIFIRDWDNFSSKNWLIDYQKISIYGKEEYLKELAEIKSTIYKHYLIETYESLIKFIAFLTKLKTTDSPTINKIVRTIDLNFHCKTTPFGFNSITFLYIFCKVRNAFTHNNSIFDIVKISTKEDYLIESSLKESGINQDKCFRFLKAYFALDINISSPRVRINMTKEFFDTMIKFTQSYAYSLFKYCSEKENLSSEIQKEKERLDIKTNKPLTDKQKDYHSKIIDNLDKQ